MPTTRTRQLKLYAPDLLTSLAERWQPDDADAQRLAAALARAKRLPAGTPEHERLLLELVDVPWTGEGSPPLAAVTAASDLEPGAAGGRSVLRADPVYLRADPKRVILVDAPTIGLSAAEADQMLEALNTHFAGEDLFFCRGSAPERWYLLSAEFPAFVADSPTSLRGRPLRGALLEQLGSGRMKQVVMEAQMVLHATAANAGRESAGVAPINSIWLWGGGELPAAGAASPVALFSDDPLALALGRRAAVADVSTPSALSATLRRPAAGTLAVVLARQADGQDLGKFRRELFEPAMEALNAGRLQALELIGGGDRFRLTRWNQWRCWRSADKLVAALRRRQLGGS